MQLLLFLEELKLLKIGGSTGSSEKYFIKSKAEKGLTIKRLQKHYLYNKKLHSFSIWITCLISLYTSSF